MSGEEPWPRPHLRQYQKDMMHEMALDDDRRWESASPSSRGTAGAPGPLMHASVILDRLRIDASSIPDDGSNTFRGRVWDISLRSSGDSEDGFILMAYFDFATAARLLESRCGKAGTLASDDVRYYLTIVEEGRRIT